MDTSDPDTNTWDGAAWPGSKQWRAQESATAVEFRSPQTCAESVPQQPLLETGGEANPFLGSGEAYPAQTYSRNTAASSIAVKNRAVGWRSETDADMDAMVISVRSRCKSRS